jgi:ribosomal protein S25
LTASLKDGWTKSLAELTKANQKTQSKMNKKKPDVDGTTLELHCQKSWEEIDMMLADLTTTFGVVSREQMVKASLLVRAESVLSRTVLCSQLDVPPQLVNSVLKTIAETLPVLLVRKNSKSEHIILDSHELNGNLLPLILSILVHDCRAFNEEYCEPVEVLQPGPEQDEFADIEPDKKTRRDAKHVKHPELLDVVNKFLLNNGHSRAHARRRDGEAVVSGVTLRAITAHVMKTIPELGTIAVESISGE